MDYENIKYYIVLKLFFLMFYLIIINIQCLFVF